jgi:hypothetical protein
LLTSIVGKRRWEPCVGPGLREAVVVQNQCIAPEYRGTRNRPQPRAAGSARSNPIFGQGGVSRPRCCSPAHHSAPAPSLGGDAGMY